MLYSATLKNNRVLESDNRSQRHLQEPTVAGTRVLLTSSNCQRGSATLGGFWPISFPGSWQMFDPWLLVADEPFEVITSWRPRASGAPDGS
jgi:hypothetical protein